jgi:hypothetical protein
MGRYSEKDDTVLPAFLSAIAVGFVLVLVIFYFKTQYEKVPLSEWVTDKRISSYVVPEHYNPTTKTNVETKFVTVWDTRKSWDEDLYFKHKDGDVICHHPWRIKDYFDGACPTAASEAKK